MSTEEFWGKVIQIMPAPAGMFAVYSDGCDPAGEYRVPVIAIGLFEKGAVLPLEIGEDGLVCVAGDAVEFLRMEMPGL